MVEDIRRKLRCLIEWENVDCSKFHQVPEDQPMFLHAISSTLEALGDPDFEVFRKEYVDGVPIGVGVELPRTPMIFEQKTRWRLSEPLEDALLKNPNYVSVADKVDLVQAMFEEEQAEGLMLEVDEAGVVKEWGDNIAIASIAAIQEREKIRIIHDGTHGVQVNHRIRVRDFCPMPSAAEKRLILQELRNRKKVGFTLLGDVAKAHRRVRVRRQDWALQACQLRPGKIWLNKVGSFGIASAAYWWSRLGGALLRLIHYLLGPTYQLESLLFADDLELIGVGQAGRASIAIAVLVLFVFGVPMKFKKFRGGYTVAWIGYEVCYRSYSLGLSAERSVWIGAWIQKAQADSRIKTLDMAAFLGRLNFAAGVLAGIRPFMGPMYAWLAAVHGRKEAKIPLYVLLILKWIQRRLAQGYRSDIVDEAPEELGIAFKTDAKAEGGRASVGGWECLGNTPPGKARWFATEVTKDWAPWAFVKQGDPQRFIAALELLGSLLAVLLFKDKWPSNRSGSCCVTGVTDNRGNSFIVSKMMSTKFPIPVLLMELSEQLLGKGMALNLVWHNRDLNVEADALTNEDFRLFDPSKRIPVTPASLKWEVLPEFMDASTEMFEQMREERKRNPKGVHAPWPKAKALDRLKARDPW
jgi:hypothetical protein